MNTDAREEEVMLRWQQQLKRNGKPPNELWRITRNLSNVLGQTRGKDEAIKVIMRHTGRSASQIAKQFAKIDLIDAKNKAKAARADARIARRHAKAAKSKSKAVSLPTRPARTVTLHIGKAQVTGTADDVLHILKQMETR
jgi:hypothetical protein